MGCGSSPHRTLISTALAQRRARKIPGLRANDETGDLRSRLRQRRNHRGRDYRQIQSDGRQGAGRRGGCELAAG